MANNLYNYIVGAPKTRAIFLKNYNDMKEANTIGADKYFHALANCQAAQQGDPREAVRLSLGREVIDSLVKNPLKGIPLKENIADSLEDWNVDMYGLQQGLKYPNLDCRILVNKYRPNGLNAKY